MICEANYIGTEFFSTRGKAKYKKKSGKAAPKQFIINMKNQAAQSLCDKRIHYVFLGLAYHFRKGVFIHRGTVCAEA